VISRLTSLWLCAASLKTGFLRHFDEVVDGKEAPSLDSYSGCVRERVRAESTEALLTAQVKLGGGHAVSRQGMCCNVQVLPSGSVNQA
jgi:hypothetical protein